MMEDRDDVDYGSDGTPCECGDAADDHQGECSAEDCECPRYTPAEDEEEERADGRAP
jgi:hypothetical protein